MFPDYEDVNVRFLSAKHAQSKMVIDSSEPRCSEARQLGRVRCLSFCVLARFEQVPQVVQQPSSSSNMSCTRLGSCLGLLQGLQGSSSLCYRWSWILEQDGKALAL